MAEASEQAAIPATQAPAPSEPEPIELPPDMAHLAPQPSVDETATLPQDSVPADQEITAARGTPVTLKTEDLEELGALDELESAEEEPPAPEEAPSEEQAMQEALGALEETSLPAAPSEEPATPEEHAASEEHAALEALGSLEQAPVPEASSEEHAAQDALGAEPARTDSATDTPETPEPEPGLALPFGEREKVWTKPAHSGAGRRPPPEWSLSGDLKNTSVPRLLNAYYEARHSGELKLRQGSVQKVVYFEAGRPVYAASNLAHERFVRFCVRRGVLPEARLQEVATLAREQNLRSSEAMMRLGILDARRHPQLIEEQVKELLWSTFSWTEGAYGFSPKRPPQAGLVKLSVFPGDLILEGILRSEPLESLRTRMSRSRRLFPTAAPPYALHELKLKGPQALLLAYTDGSKTVEDLLTLTELPERGVLATLRGLELIGVLEERRDEPASRSRISFGL
ncbi:hypothetical protein DAT35_00535 [Vitiosangium sp. GDMCC 1.1324]|nr:hypothetical protein DAT35_00535 [Vitiosangium sp. GDMCC 1.1324]